MPVTAADRHPSTAAIAADTGNGAATFPAPRTAGMFPASQIHGREAGAGEGEMPMAVSEARPTATAGVPSPWATDLPLLDLALDALLDGGRRGQPSWLRGPLVVVTSEPAFMGRAIRRGGPVATVVWPGARLGHEIDRHYREGSLSDLLPRLTASPLCLVDGVDQIGRTDAQFGLAQLIDEAAVRGTTFCVSLANHPAAADFVPHLASRLCGGLLMRGPAPVLQPNTADGRPMPSLRRVLNAVARQREMTVIELVGPSRCRTVVEARGIAMYLARGLTDKSLYEIGRACGGRDHTTVLHGVRVIERRIAHDPAFAADVARVAAVLGGAPVCRDAVDSLADAPGGAGRHRRRHAPRRPRATRPPGG